MPFGATALSRISGKHQGSSTFSGLDPNDPLGLLIQAARIQGGQDFALFTTLCWHAWYRRNCFVHKKSIPPLDSAVSWCSNFLKDLLDACRVVSPCRILNSSVWQPPVAGSFKVNVDTSVRGNNQGVGLGVIIRV